MKHVKLFEQFIAKSRQVNEATDAQVKPNSKLEKGTGFPYAMFYLSTQAANIMVNFEDAGHASLIKLMAEQDKELEKNSELSPSSISKGRAAFKKVLGENVAYGKYDGVDCTFRLSSTPSTDLTDGKKEWLSKFAKGGEGVEMEKYL